MECRGADGVTHRRKRAGGACALGGGERSEILQGVGFSPPGGSVFA